MSGYGVALAVRALPGLYFPEAIVDPARAVEGMGAFGISLRV